MGSGKDRVSDSLFKDWAPTNALLATEMRHSLVLANNYEEEYVSMGQSDMVFQNAGVTGRIGVSVQAEETWHCLEVAIYWPLNGPKSSRASGHGVMHRPALS